MRFLLAVSFCLLTMIVLAQTNPNPCLNGTSYTIVVLGSSTAAGTGPSHPDSTWVNKYRKHLESINPNNQVINLAMGGYSTWRLMPDFFVPPAGRPDPDTNRNITEALDYMPDAIIINLPSNDRSWPASDQLGNFDSLYHHSLNNGIPMWITTTQPISSSGAYQAEVKDSILAQYGQFAIDFWTGVADTNNLLLSQYSADGIHQNDAGHAIMVSRVIEKDILSFLYDTASIADIGAIDLFADNYHICGDDPTTFKAVFTNFGISTVSNIPVSFNIKEASQGLNNVQNATITGGLATCVTDTQTFTWITSGGGNYELMAISQLAGDTTISNDTFQAGYNFIGRPSLSLMGDSVCLNDVATLTASFDNGDTVFWYDSPGSSTPVQYGSTYTSSPLSGNTTFYAESVRGDLFFNDDLLTQLNSTTPWNGMMIDVVAYEELIIDSFGIKIQSLGSQGINIYYKMGGHVGFELIPGSWTLLDNPVLNVITASEFTNIPVNSFQIQQGDTVAFYFTMQNAGSNIQYFNNGQALSYINNEIGLLRSSGISNGFSAIFTPRNWSGQIFYHHGYRPDGDCKTNRESALAVVVDPPSVTLDAQLFGCDSLSIFPNAINATNYQWSTGSSASSIFTDSTAVFWLQVSNDCGTDVDATYVTIGNAPTAGFSGQVADSFIILTDLSFGADSVAITINGVPVNDLSLFQADTSGNFEVIQYVFNDCGIDSVSNTYSIQFPVVGIGLDPDNTAFKVFPNPSNGSFYINISSVDDYEFELVDLQGRSVTFNREQINDHLIRIDMELLAKGIYMLNASSASDRFTRQLIVR